MLKGYTCELWSRYIILPPLPAGLRTLPTSAVRRTPAQTNRLHICTRNTYQLLLYRTAELQFLGVILNAGPELCILFFQLFNTFPKCMKHLLLFMQCLKCL